MTREGQTSNTGGAVMMYPQQEDFSSNRAGNALTLCNYGEFSPCSTVVALSMVNNVAINMKATALLGNLSTGQR